jgi:pectate lyase
LVRRIHQPNPRVRFNERCVFNNYYLHITGYGVASQMNAGVMVKATTSRRRSRRATSAGPQAHRGPRQHQHQHRGPHRDQRHGGGACLLQYTLDPAANVPAIVSQGAGVGRLEPA